jgi:hypothetical protein
LRLREIAQLFNSMDPTPFHHKDLDPDAEEFIETWAREFPPHSRFNIQFHFEHLPAQGDATGLVTEAIRNFFQYRAEMVRRELRELLGEGKISLAIGIAFLGLCLVLAHAAGRVASGPTADVLKESLTIVGWVAMWRPLEIFLYEWWPLARRCRTYRSLARAHVRVTGGSDGSTHRPLDPDQRPAARHSYDAIVERGEQA